MVIFKWVQHGYDGERPRWKLVEGTSGRVVADVQFSKYAESYQNHELRRKIKLAYEVYFQKLYFTKQRF